MDSKKKLVFVHLLNDLSGSPKILADVIETLIQGGEDVSLLTGNKTGGFLDGVVKEGNHKTFFYKRGRSKLSILLFYVMSQVSLFFKILSYKNSNVRIHINTYLPFGAAIAGKLCGIPVVYHIMETSLKPVLLKKLLRWVVKIFSDEVVFLSEDLYSKERMKNKVKKVLYPTISDNLYCESQSYICSDEFKGNEGQGRFVVLMVCSLKAYKGVYEFLKIAKALEANLVVELQLILNASETEVADFKANNLIPSNVRIFCSQRDIVPYLKGCSILVNLSRPDQWVETFGLTILEAMMFGKPVVVPPVGAPTELVEDGVEGYQISSYDVIKVVDTINKLSIDDVKLNQLSLNAIEKSKKFSPPEFKKNVTKLFNSF